MPFGKIIATFITIVFFAGMTPSLAEAQSFLDKVKDRARDLVSDDRDESGRSQEVSGQGEASQGGANGFAGRAQQFHQVYHSRYSMYPDMRAGFQEAEAYFEEFLSGRMVRCENEWYVMDDDKFGLLVDAYPSTELYSETQEHLSKMTGEFWPYVSQVRSDQGSIYMSTRGQKSSLGHIEWRTRDQFSETDMLSGWELQARGSVDARLHFEWRESYDAGEWRTFGGFGYMLEKKNGEVDLKIFNGITTALSKKVNEWATSSWNETHEKIPEDFGRMSIAEQCAVLNEIASSN